MDLFDRPGPLTARKMMGGLTLCREDRIFGMVDVYNRIFPKAKRGFAADLAAPGCSARGKTAGCWTLPHAT